MYICIWYIYITYNTYVFNTYIINNSFQPSKENQRGNRENINNSNKVEKKNKAIHKKIDLIDYKKTLETTLNIPVI